MANEQIIDVTEETAEIMAEPVTEIAKNIDWVKFGKAAGCAALVVAGVCVVRKVGPKAVDGAKSLWNNHVESKKNKKLKNMITVEEYEVNDVVEDENDK